MKLKFRRGLLCASAILVCVGCAQELPQQTKTPQVAPTTQPAASLQVDSSQIGPMYRELLAIDLPTVARVASARNLDIREARQRVEASKGRYESNVEAIVPVIAPSIAWQHLEGVNQNANGTLTMANFNNFLPAISVQWILSPGKVVYDIIASKRRMEASQQQERSVELQTLHNAAVQYYDLVLAQAHLAVAKQAVAEAEELVRITELRVHSGTGLPADELRARAALAARQQDLALALNQFYDNSVALGLTLHLDPVVTLVPRTGPVNQTTLVREDLPVERMLAMAVEYRPDLAAARAQFRAAKADTGSALWGGIGPQVQAGYTYGGLQTHASGFNNYGLHEQQKAGASASVALGLSTFGQVKTATANERSAEIDVQRQIDQVRAAVISAQQASLTSAKLVPIANSQVEAAEEALRLAQANLKAGTMITLDVLEAQDAADEARLRYADAVIRYNRSQVDLLAALGLLNRDSLGN